VNNSWSIRDLGAQDLDDLREFYRSVWTATYLPTLGPAVVAALIGGIETSDLRHLLPVPNRHFAIATVEEQPVGTACVNVTGDVAALSAMYIAQRCQRRGVGTELLRYLVEKLSDNNRLEALVVESSASALAFYDRIGFCEIGRRSDEAARGHSARFVIMSISVSDLRARLG
jgi:ribosomal protein S18 acetylase RimI-like enzyme